MESKNERIRKRIRIAREMAGLKQEPAAVALGIKRPTLTRYESGSLNVSGEMLARMAELYGVSMDFFADEQMTNKKDAHKKGVKIPILGRIPAGVPLEAITDIEGYEEIDPEKAREGKFYALRISGRSMEPTIMDGDIIICRAQPEVPNNKIAVVAINGDEATCKRVQVTENGLALIGDNPAVYPTHFFTAKEVNDLPIRIIAQVVEVRKDVE